MLIIKSVSQCYQEILNVLNIKNEWLWQEMKCQSLFIALFLMGTSDQVLLNNTVNFTPTSSSCTIWIFNSPKTCSIWSFCKMGVLCVYHKVWIFFYFYTEYKLAVFTHINLLPWYRYLLIIELFKNKFKFVIVIY